MNVLSGSLSPLHVIILEMLRHELHQPGVPELLRYHPLPCRRPDHVLGEGAPILSQDLLYKAHLQVSDM